MTTACRAEVEIRRKESFQSWPPHLCRICEWFPLGKRRPSKSLGLSFHSENDFVRVVPRIRHLRVPPSSRHRCLSNCSEGGKKGEKKKESQSDTSHATKLPARMDANILPTVSTTSDSPAREGRTLRPAWPLAPPADTTAGDQREEAAGGNDRRQRRLLPWGGRICTLGPGGLPERAGARE